MRRGDLIGSLIRGPGFRRRGRRGMGLQVTLNVSLPPEGAVLLAEDRGGEVRARGEVIEERLRSNPCRLRRLDSSEEVLASRDQPTNGLQKPVLGSRAVQEE